MSNAELSTLQQVITILMTILGVIVALRTPEKGTWREYCAMGVFFVLGGIGVFATYVQGKRLDTVSRQQSLQLDTIQKNTEQAPNVVVENKIDPKAISDAVQQGMLPNQTERGRERAEQLLKDKTFTLATDILTFLAEREKGRPKVEMFVKSNEGVRPNPHMDQDLKDYNNYERDSVKIFQDRYWQKALQLFVELKLRGFNAESVWFQPVSSDQIRDFGIGLGNVAEKVSTH